VSNAVDEALAQDDLAVSAISFWEVTMLVRQQRLRSPFRSINGVAT